MFSVQPLFKLFLNKSLPVIPQQTVKESTWSKFGLNYSTQSIYWSEPRCSFYFQRDIKVINWHNVYKHQNQRIFKRVDRRVQSSKFRSAVLRQKIYEVILSSILCQECFDKNFAEDSTDTPTITSAFNLVFCRG